MKTEAEIMAHYMDMLKYMREYPDDWSYWDAYADARTLAWVLDRSVDEDAGELCRRQ